MDAEQAQDKTNESAPAVVSGAAVRKEKNSAAMLSPQMVEGLVAASSLGAGAIWAWRDVLAESYANFTSLDLVDDIKKKFRKDFGPEMARAIESGSINKDQATEKILKQNTAYNSAVAERFEKAGFGGFSNRLKLLNSHEKWKIALTALAVVGVSLGSVLVLTRDLFHEKSKDAANNNENLPDTHAAKSFVQAEQQKANVKEASPSLSA